jgi:hypothetical protein
MTHAILRRVKYCFFLLLLISAFCQSRAQTYYAISDANFAGWLQNNGFASCMNGNQLDISSPLVTGATGLYCGGQNIASLDGIQYFTGLDSLECSGNQLTYLPGLAYTLTFLDCGGNPNLNTLSTLPSGLLYFNCHNCGFDVLSSFPTSLQILIVDENQNLTTLPGLPSGLISLSCVACALTSLPTLPATLQTLDCTDNSILSLPPLPSALTSLTTQYNPIATLPALPTGLVYLTCDYDSLTSLPALPSTLVQLIVGGNKLTVLPALPASLSFLSCGANKLTTLPTLPAGINDIQCAGNLITSLPPFPQGLNTINCNFNRLTSLPALNSALFQIDCADNLLTALPALNDTLWALSCTGNLLTALPALPTAGFLGVVSCDSNQLTVLPALPASLRSLSCQANLLTSIPTLPDTMQWLYCQNNHLLTCLPQLNHIGTLNFQGTAVMCMPDYGVVGTSRPALDSLPLCDIMNVHNCPVFWNIAGRGYYDANSDCLYDAGDVTQGYVKIQLYKTGILQQTSFTGGIGLYSFQALGNYGLYQVRIDTSQLPFTVECPNPPYHTANVPNIDSLVAGQDFSLKCRTSGIDVGVWSIINEYAVRPNAYVLMRDIIGDMSQIYGAHCAAGVSGQVTISISGAATIGAVAPGALAPTSISPSSITWDVNDFGTVTDTSGFNFYIQSFQYAHEGDPVCINVNVTANANDYNLLNNDVSYCFNLIGSYDPNEKEVYPSGNIDVSTQWLTYVVRFQNTGTDTAINVFVMDTLDSNIDPSSFQMLTASTKVATQLFGNIVKFNFADINLVDSTANDTLSRAYVQYKVKLKSGLQLGTIVNNTASVYFDFNAPVQTNVASDTLGICTVYNDTLAQSICQGQTYQLNGQAISQPGFYSATLQTIYGCDSTVNISLSVDSIPAVTLGWDSLIAANAFQVDYSNPGSQFAVWCSPLFGYPPVVQLKGGYPYGGTYSGYLVYNNVFYGDSLPQYQQTRDTITYTYTALNGCSVSAMGIVDIDICEGLNNVNITHLSIYPNPVSDRLNIDYELNSDMNLQLGIFDVEGRQLSTVFSGKTPSGSYSRQADVNALAKGLYIIRFISDNGVVNLKFVKD